MHENNSKDICTGRDTLKYAFLSLMSHKIHVGVIGSGRAGIIKAKHFLKEDVKVTLITKDPYENNEITNTLIEDNKFKIICREYSKDFILDKHVIIIAIDNDEVRKRIKEDCDQLAKIYIDCTDFKEGLAVVPVQRESENIVTAINTKGGNPKASVFIAGKMSKKLKSYDEYVRYTTILRNNFKKHPSIKESALKFIFSDDFYFFFEKGKAEEVIKLFYSEV